MPLADIVGPSTQKSRTHQHVGVVFGTPVTVSSQRSQILGGAGQGLSRPPGVEGRPTAGDLRAKRPRLAPTRRRPLLRGAAIPCR